MHKKPTWPALLFAGALLFSFVCPVFVGAAPQDAAEAAADAPADDGSWPAGPTLSSPSALLLETTTGAVLYEKDGEAPRHPGALNKLMTVLLALENASLTDQVTFTQTGVSAAAGGASNIAAREGEVLTLEQCLYAVILSSANDACVQIAEQVGGSVDAFVEQMNARAKELGCTGTVFTDPTGLAAQGQQSTARDLAKVLETALGIPEFRTLSQAQSYTIPATNLTGAPRELKNKFPLQAEASPNLYEGALAGKEGFTQASLSTLAAAAEKNGTSLVAVVLGGPNGQTAADAIRLFDFGFQSFQRIQYSDTLATLSGGFAILPNGAGREQITTRESAADDGILQQYYYQNRLVGQAVVENLAEIEEDSSAREAAQKYLKGLDKEKSMIPYYLIFGGGGLVLLLLAVLLVKILKAPGKKA